jgi:protein-tyrosine-phosphatase
VAEGRPQSVLFACTHNALRSPMAEAIAKHYFGRDIYVQSAGLRPEALDDFAVAVMEEIGLDISKHKPRTFEEIEDLNFDLVVTLSPEAHHRALEFTRTNALDVVYWPTLDPSATHGSREQVLEAYRAVRDGLTRRIKERLEWQPIGSL